MKLFGLPVSVTQRRSILGSAPLMLTSCSEFLRPKLAQIHIGLKTHAIYAAVRHRNMLDVRNQIRAIFMAHKLPPSEWRARDSRT